MGAVSEVWARNGWDWCVEVFLGAVWRRAGGDFGRFVEGDCFVVDVCRLGL